MRERKLAFAEMADLPTSVFLAYQEATGLKQDPNSNSYYVPANRVGNMTDLSIKIGSKVYTMTPSAQLYPDKLSASYIDPSVGLLSTISTLDDGSNGNYDPLGFLGLAFVSRYTTTVETLNRSRGKQGRLSFAETSWTFARTSKSAPASKVKPAKGCVVAKV